MEIEIGSFFLLQRYFEGFSTCCYRQKDVVRLSESKRTDSRATIRHWRLYRFSLKSFAVAGRSELFSVVLEPSTLINFVQHPRLV